MADAGVVVVTAAGNLGKNASGEALYGGVTAPGNAPWVLTVGASSTNGSLTRDDDAMAGFSSRGPTYLDWAAKPDLVASGVGTISLSAPNSTFYATRPQALVDGFVSGSDRAYLTLSGTSMAAPVVAGTVALMLQANPALTPNAVKAILQYTAEQRAGYNALTQGGGFLNTMGAVRLARFFAGGAARRGVSASGGVEQEDHLGQPPSLRRRHRPLGECVRPRYDVGSRPHRRRRQHHLGYDLRRRLRQHHLG